jgi:ferredoxin
MEADPGAFRGDKRPRMSPLIARFPDGRTLTLDNGKCIACGKCVAIAQEAGEPYGLAWINRGFTVHLGPALGVDLATALAHCADACAEACPTAALVIERPVLLAAEAARADYSPQRRRDRGEK